ncbi:MAG: laccase domain-containing protein [Candidatus Falkowbacteria bacterium]
MSQKTIDLSKSKDLLYFKGLGLITGITTANFKVPDKDEYLLPEEHLLYLLEGDYFVKSDPKRLAKIVTLSPNHNRNYYSDDAIIFSGQDRGFSPVMIMSGGDEPMVVLFSPKSGLVALVNGSWENIILNLVRSTIGVIRGKFDINVSDLLAFIWPGLCRDCFHPGENLFDYLVVENKKIDLRNNLFKQLTEVGVKEGNIHSTNLCSSHSRHESGYFFNSESRDKTDDVSNSLLFVKID